MHRLKGLRRAYGTDLMGEFIKNAVVEKGYLPIKVLYVNASFDRANEIARENGSRLPTLSEFIGALRDSPEMYREAKGRWWYWLGEEPGLLISGKCRINYDACRIETVTPEVYAALPKKERAHAISGKGPVAIIVYGDDSDKLINVIGDYRTEGAARVSIIDTEAIMAESSSTLERLKRGIRKD